MAQKRLKRQKKEATVKVSLQQKETVKPISETVKIQKLGDVLQKARAQKHLKMATISKKLKIKEIYLEALENGHYFSFPALVYGIGFLRSYATFLGLNPEEMIALFHQETMQIKEEPLEMPRCRDPKIIPSFKVIAICLAILFCLYLIINVIRIMTRPVTDVPLPTPIETPTPTEEVIVPPESLKLPEKQPEEKPIAPKVYGLKTPARVSLIANQEVWIEVRDTETDKMILGKILQKGDQYNPVEDAEGLILKTHIPDALDVYVDGQLQKHWTKKKAKKGVSLLADDIMKE